MASPTENINENENFIQSFIRIVSFPLIIIVRTLIFQVHIMEQFFIKLYNIYAFVSQMCLFFSCALVFDDFSLPKKEEEFVLIGLKTLLFYSVFTYFATKTRDILSSDHSSAFQNFSWTEGLCRIVIEWAKAIVVVICLREQGIYFRPTVPYAILTFTYYLCTEKIFTQFFIKLVQYFEFEVFDELEHLYVPLILNTYATVMSVCLQLHLFLKAEFLTFAFVSCYFTTYIRLKDSYFNYWETIKVSQQTFENFRNANQKELDEYDDICAVCLNKMSKAKITPCNHFFHPSCLKECLKNSLSCPICKLDF